MTKKLILVVAIAFSITSTFANTYKSVTLSEFGATLNSAQRNFKSAIYGLGNVACEFEKARKRRSYGETEIVVVYSCKIPANCRVVDVADQQAMGHSEYFLRCNS